MSETPPRMVVVAHGTASAAGRHTLTELTRLIASARPEVPVELCFLDVVEPRLAQVLDERPTVVVPLLLATGYHVQHDIPAAAAPHARTRVAAHLGPHPLVVDALVDRLGIDPNGVLASTTVLVSAGSTRPDAADECAAIAEQLQRRMSRWVSGHVTVTATMGDDLAAVVERARPVVQVATHLLAEGAFADRLTRAVAGRAHVAPPLGAHPKLVELAWLRYDEALGGQHPSGDPLDSSPRGTIG